MADRETEALEGVLSKPGSAVTGPVDAAIAQAFGPQPLDQSPAMAGLRQIVNSIPAPESGPSILGMLKDTGNSIINLMEAGRGEKPVTIKDALAIQGPMGVGGTFYPVGSLGVFGSRLAPESGVYKRIQEGVRGLLKEQEINGGKFVSIDAADPAQVLSRTGLSKDIYNNWVYEVDDSAAALTPEFNNTHWDWLNASVSGKSPIIYPHTYGESLVSGQARLPDVLRHNELFDAFPYLKDISVVPMEQNLSGMYKGYFDPKTRTIAVDMNEPASSILSTLLHETQHAVSNTEKILNIRRSDGETGNPTYLAESLSQFARIYRRAADKGLVSIEDSQKLANYFNDLHEDIYRIYDHNPGEVEARNVQRRLSMSQADRRVIPPEMTEDTPRRDQVNLQEFRNLYRRGQELGMFPQSKSVNPPSGGKK